jgi:hypothetical protein
LDTAYSFIPGGLISTSAPQGNYSPLQQALYEYGNGAGSAIRSFEQTLASAPQIMKDQFEDRGDPAKSAALSGLADGLSGVGEKLAQMEDVPAQIATAHEKLAASYQEMGQKLALVAQTHGDEDFLDAVIAYNATVETYVRNYVELATLFSAYGVVFSSEDQGGVFVFTNTGF